MASSSSSSATSCFLISSNHRHVSPLTSSHFSLSIPNSFNAHCLSLRTALPSSLSVNSASRRRPCFVVKTSSELPLVGNQAPDFEAEAVFDQEFIQVKLSEYIGKKYVILFFYPLDFTFVCPTEITAFSDRYEEFEKLNTEILGVPVDSSLSWFRRRSFYFLCHRHSQPTFPDPFAFCLTFAYSSFY